MVEVEWTNEYQVSQDVCKEYVDLNNHIVNLVYDKQVLN